MPITIVPSLASRKRNLFKVSDLTRRRTLARLYERRAIVDKLIRCLEQYQSNQARRMECITLAAPPKWS
jgi:hypothetical protein